ncbi:MAG: PIG-L family deacetylase [Actinobacteria bacterium]|nr:PIG-L family deacetylase [Actinomycetota bacterium]
MSEPVLSEETPERVLAVYGHPDDAEISAGGTLARWASGGAEVYLLICTQGEKGSQDPLADPDAVARTRTEESRRASAALGFAGNFHLDHLDGELDNDHRLRGEIVEHIRKVRPTAVMCPDPTSVFFGDRYYNHRDHRVTGWATLDAVSPAAGNPHYFRDQLERGLEVHHVGEVFLSGTFEPNCWVDIGATIDHKIDALFCHESQLTDTGEWFRDFLRERAEDAGRQAGVRYAEGFRRLSFG